MLIPDVPEVELVCLLLGERMIQMDDVTAG
jgi:hypothetical protein